MDKVKKKAQATVFIVIGLIILAVATSIFLTQRSAVEAPLEKEAQEQKPQLTGQTELKSFVDSCLQDAALQGLEILRLQGGYIDIPESVQTLAVKDKENKQIEIVNGIKKVVLDANGIGNQVPFWLTKDSLAVPSIQLMEKQLENYIEQGINECVNDFSSFKEQGFNIDYGSVAAEVSMESAVTARLNFPITAQKDEIKVEIDEFIFTVPIDMKFIVERAKDITGFEDKFSFLEDNTKSLISLYSGIDAQRLPPFSMSITNFDCSSVSWTKTDVEQRLKAILSGNLPNLKIENTNFERITTNDPISQGVYDSFIYRIFNQNFPTLKIDFSYRPEWDFIEYDIKPNSGDSLVPDSVRQEIPLVSTICVFDYAYKYTIDYPVLVEIKDEKSARIDPVAEVYFGEEGFIMQYLVDSYICGNQKRECTGRPSLELDFSSALNDLDVDLLPETLFCDEEQKISDEITVNIFDAETNTGLSNVNVFYSCGSYRNDCSIGQTDKNGILKSKFPLCINGILYTQKNDYADSQNLLTVHGDHERNLIYKLDPLKEVKVRVKKIDLPLLVKNFYETGNLDLNGIMENLDVDESATISAFGPQIISYNYPDPTDRKIKLSTGIYNLTVTFNDKIDIPDSEIQGNPVGGFIGNIVYGLTNTEWKIDRSEIKGTVTFFTLANFDSTASSLGTIDDIDDPILSSNGDISAELLYQCDSSLDESTGQLICDFSNCNFVEADGTLIDDFVDDETTCQQAFDVEINKEVYGPLIRPQFS